MDINDLKNVVKVLKDNNLKRIYIETNNLKLDVSNCESTMNLEKNMEQDLINDKIVDLKIENGKNQYIINSPLVGTVHISKNFETQKNYIVGDRVEVGNVLCLIEAMKSFNEITSEIKGNISEILFVDGEFIEYNQPLFKLIE